MSVSIDRLRDLFDVDAEAGVIRWRASGIRAKAGAIAGGLSGRGYCYVGVDGLKLKVHRIVFALVHGYWPVCVDHINGIKTDNRPENLRDATHAENMRNSKLRKDNTSGFKGVTWDARAAKWQAQAHINGRCKFLGYFTEASEAAEVAARFRSQHHMEFARHV